MADEKFLKKMSIKQMGCDPTVARQKENTGKNIPLCTIAGFANGTRVGENRRDGTIWTALLGEFKGRNLATGDLYTSGMVFLPGGVQELIEGAIKQADSGVVEFALKIMVTSDDSTGVGYKYLAQNLKPVVESSRMAELMRLADEAVGIAPPDSINEPEPEPEPRQIAPPVVPAPAPPVAPAAVSRPAAVRKGAAR